eukprot:Tamp_07347.p1 GENE.Tamp_07347~~Tamp_07347.p1  ORF type:complete len:650 (+),score=103.81 Tamp_07347:73-1950(+)
MDLLQVERLAAAQPTPQTGAPHQLVTLMVDVARAARDSDAVKDAAVLRLRQTESPELIAAFFYALGMLWRNLAQDHPQINSATQNSFMAFQAASEADPTCARAFTYMGIIFEKMGRYASSADYFQRALNAHPPADMPRVLASTASVSNSLLWLGEVDEAVEVLEAGIKKAATAREVMGIPCQFPFDAVDPTYVQSYLFALNMSSKPRDQVSNAHMEFGKLARSRVGPLVPCEVKDTDPTRRLRVGYLSGDLCKHVVAECLEGVLRARDREMQHVTCYQRNIEDDKQTEVLRSLADEWVKCANVSASEVNKRIRSDQIDILIDLGGHTGNTQIGIMALCPAPIQVTWIGYPNTTGLDCVHYRITDGICDPFDSTQAYSEKLVRLPTFFNCLQKTEMIHVAPNEAPPMIAREYCTFGSFNSLRKHSKRTKRTWGRILMGLPEAQLMLKDKAFMHPQETERWTKAFLQCACDPSIPGVNFKTGPKLKKRLRLVPGTPTKEDHWGLYNEMDIMLDSWPYCGTITSVECLMMGVPIVTLQSAGKDGCHAQNVTASILTQVGLSDLIANSEDEYVQIATDLAKNPARVAQLKTTLRDKCMATVCNPEPSTLCREVEAEFRKMWLQYIDTAK